MTKSKGGFTLGVLMLGLLAWSGIGQASEFIDQERLADAIYLAEGGAKAKVAYGILSVKVKDKSEARKVCINTINRNLARWQWARQEGDKRDYITFLGSRYCPTSEHSLNKHWVNNVKELYAS